jgi:hypothetical protein
MPNYQYVKSRSWPDLGIFGTMFLIVVLGLAGLFLLGVVSNWVLN